MPSTWTQNFYHAVFSTKQRAALIKPPIEARLFPFIGGVVRDRGGSPLAIGGMPDHLHLLMRYPPNIAHSDLLRHIKGRSSKWIHETFPELRGFAWQEGYGGFPVCLGLARDQYRDRQGVASAPHGAAPTNRGLATGA